MPLDRLVVNVRGRVQRAGYRYFIDALASRHGLTGYVQNRADGSVRIVAEGQSAELGQFRHELAQPPPPASVTHVDIREGRASGRFPSFTIRYGGLADEVGEGFAAGFHQLQQLHTDFQQLRADFQGLDTKYGIIADEMKAIRGVLETLTRSVQDLTEALRPR